MIPDFSTASYILSSSPWQQPCTAICEKDQFIPVFVRSGPQEYHIIMQENLVPAQLATAEPKQSPTYLHCIALRCRVYGPWVEL
jgi:hypothetical protein